MAKDELHEDPETRGDYVETVQEMTASRPDLDFLRTDEAFVLRFLRARKFCHMEAFQVDCGLSLTILASVISSS